MSNKKFQKGQEFWCTVKSAKVRVIDEVPVRMRKDFEIVTKDKKVIDKTFVGEYIFCSYVFYYVLEGDTKRHRQIHKEYLPASSFRQFKKRSEKIQKVREEENLLEK